MLRDWVAADVQRGLALHPPCQGRQAAVQMLQAGFLELAEHLEVIATASQYGARTEEQLVEVAVRLDGRLFQQCPGGIIPALLIDAVLLVPVHALHLVLATDIEHRLWRLVPGIDCADQQGYVQLFQ